MRVCTISLSLSQLFCIHPHLLPHLLTFALCIGCVGARLRFEKPRQARVACVTACLPRQILVRPGLTTHAFCACIQVREEEWERGGLMFEKDRGTVSGLCHPKHIRASTSSTEHEPLVLYLWQSLAHSCLVDTRKPLHTSRPFLGTQSQRGTAQSALHCAA